MLFDDENLCDENLCVDSKKATLEVEAETNGEMYVSGDDFVPILITICHHRF